MPEIRLTPTSYVVMGLIEWLQPATPYDLKQAATATVSQLWSLPHTQLYSECARLAEAGHLSEKREESGRRRRIYRLTAQGSEALDAWRAEPTSETYEIRDAGLLKLLFGGAPGPLAERQLVAHQARLEELESYHEAAAELPEGARLAIEAGIGHEREYLRFWSEVAGKK